MGNGHALLLTIRRLEGIKSNCQVANQRDSLLCSAQLSCRIDCKMPWVSKADMIQSTIRQIPG